MAIIGNTYLNRRFGFTLDGTGDSDTIYGRGGADWIYGGGGVDALYGGTGNDHIYAGSKDFPNHNAFWGSDYVEGGSGNDTIDFRSNLSDGTLIYGDSWTAYTDDGIDTIYGGFGNDTIYGGGNNDTLIGGFGNDHIYGDWGSGNEFTNDGVDILVGGEGNDYIYGGGGNDVLNGGSGRDILTGGSGENEFIWLGKQDSGLTSQTADVITDFYSPWDNISVSGFGPRGTADNYAESTSYSKGFDAAANVASYMIHGNTKFAFVTDGTDGYVFMDSDYDGKIDSGITLKGAASLDSFGYWDLTH